MFWPEFGILFLFALLGGAAVIPYGHRLLPKDRPQRFSISVLLLLSFVQTALFFAGIIALGLFAAHAIGHGAPYIEALLAGTMIPSKIGIAIASGLGILAGATLLVADLRFLPYWPHALLESAKKTTMFERFLASFYGGINEELLMRLCGLSVLVWLASLVSQINVVIFWIANILMTILFAVGHLPALKGVVGSISRIVLTRTLLLNAPIGLLCGWLFWIYGIEAAIIAHFSADIVYLTFGSLVLRRRIR
jgi:Type II CAAX prenyl endopeptidase Rce1-like